MKILVTAKRVVDYNVNIRVLADQSGVDLNNVKMSVNPFDEIAIEEAVRLKEAGKAEEVIVVSVGVSQCQEQLRTALALGADRGILVETDEALQPLGIAKALKAVIDKEAPGLIITGKQASMGIILRQDKCWRHWPDSLRRRLPQRSILGKILQRSREKLMGVLKPSRSSCRPL